MSLSLDPGAEPGRAPKRAVIHAKLLERLRDLIIEGELPAGERVPERMLCERFGVSRTPLREALKALAAEGLIELPAQSRRLGRAAHRRGCRADFSK